VKDLALLRRDKEPSYLKKSEEETIKDFISNPNTHDYFESYNYAKTLDSRFKRNEMILVIDHILDEIKSISKKKSLPISPILSLTEIFKLAYPIPVSSLQPGAIVEFLFREETQKYIEF